MRRWRGLPTRRRPARRRMGDLQALVPALAGLARVLAGDDPAQASALAQRAAATAPGWARPPRCSPSAMSRWPPATARARRRPRPAAGAAARARRDRARMAEALELEGLSARERPRAPRGARAGRRHLARARQPAGRGPRAARAGLALPGRARRRRGPRGRGAPARARRAPADARRPGPEPLRGGRHQALGRFRVLRDGARRPALGVALAQGARPAEVFVARHGRPVSRDALIEALWPEEDPARCANRLSVALSTLRGVLDPDRRFAADRYVVSSAGAMSLDLDRVAVDLEAFLRRRRRGWRCTTRAGAGAARLSAAEAAYAGDLLEEDLYEDGPSRRASRRATCTSASPAAWPPTRTGGATTTAPSASCCASSSATPTTRRPISALVTALVDAGRHGEARRAFRVYRRRMDEVGVEPPVPSSVACFTWFEPVARDHARYRMPRPRGSRPSRRASRPARRCKGSRSTSAPARPPRSPKRAALRLARGHGRRAAGVDRRAHTAEGGRVPRG